MVRDYCYVVFFVHVSLKGEIALMGLHYIGLTDTPTVNYGFYTILPLGVPY